VIMHCRSYLSIPHENKHAAPILKGFTMSSVRYLPLSALAYSGSIIPSYAHLGHLGEIAGHSHWIGLGAVVVAGVLAVAVGKLREQECDEDEEVTDEEGLKEGNAA